MRRLFRFGFLAVLACGSSATATLAVTLGGETDTISRNPAVDTFIIEAVDRAGNRQSLMDAAKWSSGSSLDLGELPQSTVASIQLTASQADGSAVVWGAVPFAELGAFDGLTIPLFVQRKGDTARMPGTIEAGTGPFLVATTRGIYAAGSDTNLLGYDMLYLQALGSCGTPTPTQSFALVISPNPNSDGEQVMAWRIADDDASVVGLLGCTGNYGGNVSFGDSGVSWSDFAGGRTVMDASAYPTAYIVGPSRTSGAQTGVIFKITPDSEASTPVDAIISSISITPRRGAATAWSNGHGLFVYGGASAAPGFVGETVSSSGGVDEIGAGDGGADTREGLAAIAIDNDKMLLAGDGTPPIVFDLACTGCALKKWDNDATGVPLTSASLFPLPSGAFLLVGDDATGATRLFRLSDSAYVEKPLKIARQGARAIRFDTGQIVIIGGGSATPESYVD